MSILYHPKPQLGTQYIPGHRLGPSGGLIGHWLLDEESGYTVYDQTDNRSDCTMFAMSMADRVVTEHGRALYFGGGLKYVQRDEGLVSSYPFTLGAWYRNPNSNWDCMIWIGDKDAIDGYYALLFELDKKVCVYARNQAARTNYSLVEYTDSDWHFAVGVFVGDRERHLYVDGVYQSTGVGLATCTPNINRIAIGALRDNSPGAYFTECIGNTFIYDRALTIEDVQQLYRDPYCMFVQEDEYKVWMKAAGQVHAVLADVLNLATPLLSSRAVRAVTGQPVQHEPTDIDVQRIRNILADMLQEQLSDAAIQRLRHSIGDVLQQQAAAASGVRVRSLEAEVQQQQLADVSGSRAQNVLVEVQQQQAASTEIGRIRGVVAEPYTEQEAEIIAQAIRMVCAEVGNEQIAEALAIRLGAALGGSIIGSSIIVLE